MENQIIPLDGKNYKVLGFNQEQIVLSSKSHKSMDSLLESSQKSGMLETVLSVPLKSLMRIFFNEKDESFKLRYSKDGKTKNTTVEISDSSLRDAVAASIASVKSLEKTVVSESKTMPLLKNILGIIIIPVATWIFRDMAIDAQNGEHYTASGRRSGFKQLLANAVEFLGPTGVTIIGVLALLYMIYVTQKRYNNPASDITYK